MRIVVLFCGLIGLAGQAAAADYRALQRSTTVSAPSVDPYVRPSSDQPVLRGSHVFEPREPDFVRWDGFYAGGQFAYGVAHAGFSRATQPLIANALRITALEAERRVSGWNVLGSGQGKGSGFGSFVGYNMQWQDAIVGVELNYTRTSLNIVAPSSTLTRATSAGGNAYVVTLRGSGSMKITDLATLRVRSGWAYGNLMPYGSIGFALGRANYSRSVRIDLTENGAPFSFSASDRRKGVFMYGVAFGAGVEYGLMSNIFLRGEYEFTQFLPVADTRIAPYAHMLRAGVGMRF